MTYTEADVRWYCDGRDAVIITRVVGGKTQYRVSPGPLRDDDIPARGYLSDWCASEARAWHAAACRLWNRTYDKIS
jgi:hypothetical protein